MSNLMDGIRKFKAQRQSAEAIPEVRDEVAELVRMYEAIKPGEDGLKKEFSRRWDKLPETKRTELVDRLLKDGLLPPEVRCALEMFNGKVVSLV